jgi:hypothetical protein
MKYIILWVVGESYNFTLRKSVQSAHKAICSRLKDRTEYDSHRPAKDIYLEAAHKDGLLAVLACLHMVCEDGTLVVQVVRDEV